MREAEDPRGRGAPMRLGAATAVALLVLGSFCPPAAARCQAQRLLLQVRRRGLHVDAGARRVEEQQGAKVPLLRPQEQAPCGGSECGANPSARVVEVDLVDKECVVMAQTWFDGPAIGSSPAVKDSPLDCCKACFAAEQCSVWTYCEREGGCTMPGDPTRQLPYHGCRLIALPNFHPVANSSTSFRVVNNGVPFLSGAPITLSLPKVPDYQINPGVDLNQQFDYACPESPRTAVCEVAGTAQELAELCNANVDCKGFVYLPHGLDFRSSPIGILKGGKGVTRIPLSAVAVNPSTALFLKDSTVFSDTPVDAGDGGSSASGGSGSHTVLYVLVPVAAGVALVLAAAWLVVARHRWRRRRQEDLEKEERQRAAAAAVEAAAAEGGGGPFPGSGSSHHHLYANSLPKSAGPAWPVAAHTAPGSGPPWGATLQQGPMHSSPSSLYETWRQLARPLPSQQRSWQQRARSEPDPATAQELLRRFGDAGGSGSGSQPPSTPSSSDPHSYTGLLQRSRSGGGHSSDGRSTAGHTPPGPSPLSASPAGSLDPPPDSAVGGSAAAAAAPVAVVLPGQHAQQQQQQQQVGLAAQGGLPPRPHDVPWPPPPAPVPPPPDGSSHLRPLPSMGQHALLGALPSASLAPSASVELHPLPWSDWVLQPEEIEVCRRPGGEWWLLGSGAFGTVYKGLYHGVQPVAVKVLHSDTDGRVLHEFLREITLLKSFRDRNIVQFLGASLTGPAAMLVTEYMELGDLWRALPLCNQSGERIFAWARRGRRVALDVARGLHYLHHKRVVHLDLKSANILLSRHGTAKICDVGFARVLTREAVSMLGGTAGTFAWSAPEVLAGKRCTEKVDLYSLGIVIWEICTGEMPVRGDLRPLRVPEDCPAEVADLFARCTAEDPAARPTALEVVELLTALA